MSSIIEDRDVILTNETSIDFYNHMINPDIEYIRERDRFLNKSNCEIIINDGDSGKIIFNKSGGYNVCYCNRYSFYCFK